MKDILFGDSFKETQDTVKKVESEIKEKIPNVASGGILGTAAGSLIGGPLVGAVLGSALGIATNSETVQTALFGEKVMKYLYVVLHIHLSGNRLIPEAWNNHWSLRNSVKSPHVPCSSTFPVHIALILPHLVPVRDDRVVRPDRNGSL